MATTDRCSCRMIVDRVAGRKPNDSPGDLRTDLTAFCSASYMKPWKALWIGGIGGNAIALLQVHLSFSAPTFPA